MPESVPATPGLIELAIQYTDGGLQSHAFSPVQVGDVGLGPGEGAFSRTDGSTIGPAVPPQIPFVCQWCSCQAELCSLSDIWDELFQCSPEDL